MDIIKSIEHISEIWKKKIRKGGKFSNGYYKINWTWTIKK